MSGQARAVPCPWGAVGTTETHGSLRWGTMSFQIRPLSRADRPASSTLGAEAFGTVPAPPEAEWPPAGHSPWGTFDGATLAARAFRRAYTSWFGGASVPTNGLAGVTVAAEYRGRGLLGPLIGQVLADGRAAGDVISTLFASAPGIYHRLGYALLTSYDVVEIPTTAAAAVRLEDPARGPGPSADSTTGPADPAVTTRRATAADGEAIARLYDRWAAAQNGPLTRTGPNFPPTELTREFTGVSVATGPDGLLQGYVSWDRGRQEGPDAALTVHDLIATTPGAYRVLWRLLGSFAPVLGVIRLRTSGADVARLFLPPAAWRTIVTDPYMLRLDDVAAAFTLRRLVLSRDVVFSVTGDTVGVMDGTYLLTAGEEGATCRRIGAAAEAPPGAPVYTPPGIALAWAGAQSSANIRMAGGLTGGDEATDAAFDRALGGWQVHIRDAF